MVNIYRDYFIYNRIMEEEIKIVFENENYFLLNKPCGYVTTDENNKSGLTVENWIRKNRGVNLARQGIVHRLDKGTSGLLLVAKNQKYLDILKSKFKKREVFKKYIALVSGDLPSEGEIRVPIGRIKKAFGKFGAEVDGKKALTLFKLIKKYKIENKIYSLVDVEIKTGRTHQIRVHFSYLSWPLVGDKVYGGPSNFGLDRPFLHSYFLDFGEGTYKIDLAIDLKNHLKKYEQA